MAKLLKECDPQLLREYDWDKNDEALLETITIGSSHRVWWKCEKGHPSYQATCANRIKQNTNCPYCSNSKVFDGNSLATVSPHIAAEWNYEKNKQLTPDDVMNGSGKKVWWLCPYGHEWEAIIHPRTKRGVGCPECFKRTNTSFSEQCIFYYFQQVFPNVENRKKIKVDQKVFEADIYIHELNVAIEYDGARTHKNKFAQDFQKRTLFQNIGIRIVNIREGELPSLTNDSQDELIIQEGRWMKDEHRNQMLKRLINLLDITHTFDIDVARDRVHILEMYHRIRAKNNIAQKAPEIAFQWHPTKNGHLKAEFFPYGSAQKVWWLGNCGHEWQAVISSRTRMANGCPYCKNLAVNETNSFEHLNPELLKYWDFDKNNANGIYPSQVVPSSTKEVWWNCSYEHAFKSQIRSRLRSKHEGCPYCINRKVSKENSLGTNRKWVFQYWDFENNKKSPFEFSIKSESKVFWKCKNCAYTWEERIDSIERRKSYKCVNCERKSTKRSPKHDGNPKTLLNAYLVFRSEWNFEKNSHLNISSLLCESQEIAWWKCKEGHEWYRKIEQRTKHFKDCPWCFSNVTVKNPISDHKILMRYWDHEQNTHNPNDIGIYSSLKMNWKCEKNHKWIDSPDKVSYCPKCEEIHLREKNRKILFQNQEIFQEWDTSKNKNINLELLKMGSSKKYSWKCRKNPEHQWDSTILNRIGPNKNGCPYCAGKRKSYENTLHNARPDVAKFWDFEKNKDTPEDVVTGSSKRRYWRCPSCQYTWENRIDSITKRKVICLSCKN